MVRSQLLPDVSQLEIDDILILKDKMKNDFDPLRAELLGLTEVLRGLVTDETNQKTIANEAAILISTRVEPVLRHYASTIEGELKGKYFKYLKKAIRLIGFSAIGYLLPQYSGLAAKEGIDLAAESFSERMDIKPASETAKFALKMNSLLDKKA